MLFRGQRSRSTCQSSGTKCAITDRHSRQVTSVVGLYKRCLKKRLTTLLSVQPDNNWFKYIERINEWRWPVWKMSACYWRAAGNVRRVAARVSTVTPHTVTVTSVWQVVGVSLRRVILVALLPDHHVWMLKCEAGELIWCDRQLLQQLVDRCERLLLVLRHTQTDSDQWCYYYYYYYY